nr:Tex-like N-terminal domain-containing protein [Calditrichia bacterium]
MNEAKFYQIIAGELNIRAVQVSHTVELLDAGNTVPFIARYRKEVTGKLDEEQIRDVEE